MSERIGKAVWKGGLKGGNGRVSTGSGDLDQPYGFSSRFEDGKGTNPEELIGAAHAACFSMALAHSLERAGYQPEEINTEDRVTLEKRGDDMVITRIHVLTEARVPQIGESEFQAKAQEVKENCPVSKALSGPEITLSAILKTESAPKKQAV